MAVNHHGPGAEQAIETPLDDSIRAALRGEVRRATNSPKTWTRILQRAQTEISQLPAVDESEAAVETAHEIDLEPLPEHYVLLSRDDGFGVNLMGNDLSQQIGYYRRLMDMKMWRSVGALGMLSGTL